MIPPIGIVEAEERGLLVFLPEKGIHTFSNGDHWDSWASGNCFRCRFYAPNCAGEDCAFEGAALLGSVSPELARMFGWTESAKYPGSFREPEQCPFFKERKDSDDTPTPPPPDPDPAQFVLIADPTEDAAGIREAPAPIGVPQHA